jgi:hypothetical protein
VPRKAAATIGFAQAGVAAKLEFNTSLDEDIDLKR